MEGHGSLFSPRVNMKCYILSVMFRLCVASAICLFLGAQNAPFQPRHDLEQGRFLKVLADAETILAENNKHAVAWAAKAQSLSALMDFKGALVAAQTALELQPGLADALVARSLARAGTALQQRNLGSLSKVSQAMEDLRSAVKNDPDYPLAWMTLGLGYQQLPGILGGSTRKANECAEQLKRIQPARGDLLHAQMLSMGGRWGQAEPIFKRALAAAPNDSEIVVAYLDELGGDAARRVLGERGQKQQLAQEAMRLLPSVRTKARGIQAVSHALMSANHLEDSWKVALEALPNVDSPSIVRLQLGKVAARTGINKEEGLAFLDQAAKEPMEGGTGGYASVHWRRGQILQALGLNTQAHDAALKALTFDSQHRGAKELLSALK
jgi:tetratricopeptide (TPR) repeat protein